MLDPKYIRENVNDVKKNVKARKSDADVDAFLRVDKERSKIMREIEDMRADRNVVAKDMGSAKTKSEKDKLIKKGKKLKDETAAKEAKLKEMEGEWKTLLQKFPNLTHSKVPKGDSDADNVEIKKFGKVKKMKDALDHVELAKKHDLIDFERAAKTTGAKFYFLKNKLAILEQALMRYSIDFAIREGFEFLKTPDLSKEEVLVGKGYLPRGPEKQVYFVEGEDLALIGTSEITVLGYHMNEMLSSEEMPKKYVAFSHCFRTEAGAYGRESYGLYRVHQFDKVEMFVFTLPDQSEAVHKEFLRLQQEFWKSLEVPFRAVDCCTGDLGGSDYRRYDLEAWMPGRENGKGGWGEVTSTSNCLDYQSRGLNIKFKSKEGDKGLAHTLNGTVAASPRALIPILENHQQADGSIKIPKVLVSYCGFDKIG
ncbi:MAG: serine--tRNA ligase [Patescibacteria group bacterium]